MKRIFLFLFPLMLLFSTASAEEIWQKLGTDQQGTSYYVDINQLALLKENLSHKDPVIAEQTKMNPKRVWIKATLAKPDEKNNNFQSYLFLVEYTLTDNQYRLIYTAFYTKDDQLMMPDKIEPNAPWKEVRENDLFGVMQKYVLHYLKTDSPDKN